MPGPSLEYTIRALIQAVKFLWALKVPSKGVLVAVHTSLDFVQMSTEPHPNDPAVVTLPNCFLIGPRLIDDPSRRQPPGVNVYRNPDDINATLIKEPYPRFKDISFAVKIESGELLGEAGILNMIQVFTAWAQEGPRIAGRPLEMDGEFSPDENVGNLGDVQRSVANIKVKGYRMYGGEAKVIKTVTSVQFDIYEGDAPVYAFSALPSGVSYYLQASWQSSPEDIYAVGLAGTIVHSTGDGGWAAQESGVSSNLYAIWGSGPTDIWAAGENGVVLHSDGSGTWTPITTSTTRDLFAISGRAAAQPFFVGELGFLAKYTVGGGFVAVASGTTRSLRACVTSSAGVTYAVGDKGTVLSYNGTTVTQRPIDALTSDLRAVMLHGSTLYIGGAAGMILSSGDGGATFAMPRTPTSADINAAWSSTAGQFFAGSEGSVLRLTADGWVMENTGTALDLFGLGGSSPFDLYVVGEAGLILHRAEGR